MNEMELLIFSLVFDVEIFTILIKLSHSCVVGNV